MSIQKRLREVRSSLRMTQKQVADILSIGQNAYSLIESGRVGLTLKNRLILEKTLGVSSRFLLEGEGPMILRQQSSAKQVSSQDSTLAVVQSRGVPYFSKSVSSRRETFLELDPADIEYYIDFEPFNDCTFYRPVFGRSMEPRYNSGDIIACKRVNSKSNILYGQCYLCVISNDGDVYETLVILRRSDYDNDTEVVLLPFNSAYERTTVPLSSIVELYLICGKIERNI
ncbi:MAG: XRE family transcriptional regulator [Rikenellaceae bacterium]